MNRKAKAYFERGFVIIYLLSLCRYSLTGCAKNVRFYFKCDEKLLKSFDGWKT